MLLPINTKSIQGFINHKLLVIVVVIIITGNWSYGNDIDGQVAAVESLYNQGLYQQINEQVNNILLTQKSISDSLLVRLYTYQAFAYVALDDRDAALNAFRYLLILSPNLQLDPRFVSPKIIEIFEESKRITSDSIKIKSVFVPSELTVNNSSIRRQQAIRSLLYPGLGQLYNNQKKSGYLLLGAETVSLIGLVASNFLAVSAHKKYLENQDVSKMDELYNKYALWYRFRIGFSISSIGIWIFNYINVTLTD